MTGWNYRKRSWDFDSWLVATVLICFMAIVVVLWWAACSCPSGGKQWMISSLPHLTFCFACISMSLFLQLPLVTRPCSIYSELNKKHHFMSLCIRTNLRHQYFKTFEIIFSPFIILDPWYTGNFEWLWVAPCDVCPGRSLPWDGCRSSASLASLSSMYPGLRLVWWRERMGTVWAGFFGSKAFKTRNPCWMRKVWLQHGNCTFYWTPGDGIRYTMVSLHVSLYYGFGCIISSMYDTNLKHVRCDEIPYACLIDDSDTPIRLFGSTCQGIHVNHRNLAKQFLDT